MRYESSAAMIACTEIAGLDLQSLYGVRGIISNPFAKDVEVDERPVDEISSRLLKYPLTRACTTYDRVGCSP